MDPDTLPAMFRRPCLLAVRQPLTDRHSARQPLPSTLPRERTFVSVDCACVHSVCILDTSRTCYCETELDAAEIFTFLPARSKILVPGRTRQPEPNWKE